MKSLSLKLVPDFSFLPMWGGWDEVGVCTPGHQLRSSDSLLKSLQVGTHLSLSGDGYGIYFCFKQIPRRETKPKWFIGKGVGQIALKHPTSHPPSPTILGYLRKSTLGLWILLRTFNPLKCNHFRLWSKITQSPQTTQDSFREVFIDKVAEVWRIGI